MRKITIILACLVFMVAWPVHAKEIILPNGQKYIGEVNAKNQPHGTGKAYYQNGKLWYDGQWKNGKPHGNGKIYLKNGTLINDRQPLGPPCPPKKIIFK